MWLHQLNTDINARHIWCIKTPLSKFTQNPRRPVLKSNIHGPAEIWATNSTIASLSGRSLLAASSLANRWRVNKLTLSLGCGGNTTDQDG